MQIIKSSKAVALVTTALFVASLFWLMNTKRVNSSLEAGLNDEKLKSEQLLSEKLLLEKDIDKMKGQLVSLKETNLDLNDAINKATARLQAQEADYKRMKRENASLAQIKEQRKALTALQSQLENELLAARNANVELEEKNKELTNSVAMLQEKNRILGNDLNRALFSAVDHSMVQAVKKSQRLTVKAKRTKKLMAHFEVPSGLKTLSFRITDDRGKVMTEKDGTIVSTITPSEQNVTASTDDNQSINALQKVEMTFVPKARLKSGVYTVEILNDNLYVGSMKLKLN